ncbi:UDP-glucuronosyl/UDP-glucosyltransferase [Artemisia annua]|uniref:Glycosyltransferase n=1 Tax=Artemisia annua TaxID=35608 RepID=A0A2U1L2Y4_ARTAN|nr:UDP-glucuronosyl/UDP-glucosyltransferase [Artemisia annua]
MGSENKPHVVLVPYPAQGHVNPFMKLAKLLHSNGFHITFVNTEFNHKRLIRSKGPESVKGLLDFRFETIPDGMPYSDRNATQDIPMLCDMTRKTCLGPFKDLLCRLNESNGVPKVSCVIGDGVMTFAIQAAKDLGIPEVQFWTSPACAFMGFLHYREFLKRGIVPFKDDSYLTDGTLEKPIDWIPGMSNIRYKDIPSFIRTTDPDDIMFDFMGEEAQNNLKASAIIFNTFEALEHKVLEAMASKFKYYNIYTIGPLPLLASKYVPDNSPVQSLNSSLWKPDVTCLQWLDQKGEGTVIYINYGSVTTMTEQHLIEFAWGLANSMQPFLWVVRPDVTMRDSTMLPQDFLDEIKDRGLLVNWCAQDQVLAHPSVGAFLSHCGWNSTTESILEGVPLICWPFFSDQQTNCRYACVEWGIGMEINHDVKRNEVEVLVKEMLQGEKGKEMRRNAKEWKRKAREASDVGGSSYKNFQRFMNEALLSGDVSPA